MYADTVTIFNRYQSRLGDMWYPTILHDVNINTDKANIVAKYGEKSSDRTILNVKYEMQGDAKVVGGKEYFLPKEWQKQINDNLPTSITFTSGEAFDFFIVGEYSEEPINDEDYLNGFYDYMNANYDNVFVVTSVSEFSVIPHFEITGK